MSMRVVRGLLPAGAGFALLIAAVPVRAQSFMGSSSGVSGSSFGGSPGSGSGMGSGSSFGTSSGSSFLGSSSSFLGSSGTTGSGTTPGSRTTGGRTGAGTTTPGSTTFLGPSYLSPVALGYNGLTTFPASSANPSVIRSTQFGNAMFTITQTTPAGGNFSSVRPYGVTGSANIQPAAPGMPMYASTVGVRKAPTYVTEPRFRFPAPSLAALEADVRGAVERSNRLQSNGNSIRVALDGSLVKLIGTVSDVEDRHLAEDLVRLVPGVRDVSNELTVKTAE
jgi:hypothetical protein